jgi:MFS family permease
MSKRRGRVDADDARVRPFPRVLAASTASNLGDGVLLAALPLLARRVTDAPMAVASVTVAATAPWLVFGLAAGAIVDRAERFRLLVHADVVRAALLALFTALVVVDQISLGTIVVLVALVGIAETLFDTAAQAVLPALVEESELERANGRLFAGQLAANGFVGPPLGGALFVAASWSPFALDAASFAGSALLLTGLRSRTLSRSRQQQTATRQRSLRADVAEGLRWLWGHRGVRAFAIGAAVINVAHTGVMAVAVLFVRDELGAGATGFGLTLAGAAVGGLAGSLGAGRVVAWAGRRRAVLGGIGLFSVALAVAGVAPGVAVAALGLAMCNAAGEVWNVVAVSYRQARVPDELLGRVMASYRVIAYGAMPTGALLGGAVATVFGLRAPFVVGAVLVAGLLVWFVPATGAELAD